MNPLRENEALQRLLELVRPMPVEHVELEKAAGRILAEDVMAEIDGPPFANSAVDGYALHQNDLAEGSCMTVADAQPAGRRRELSVAPGRAIRVFTGAPIPNETAAVVMQEDVESSGGSVTLRCGVTSGENIRRAGTDVCRGQKLLSKGSSISAAAVALLSSQGRGTVPVGSHPRVALASTGDELRRPGEPLGPGEIHESNLPMLFTLASRWGARVFPEARLHDDQHSLVEFFREGLEGDFLVVSGGVSVGERDFVRPALEQLGVEINFWKIDLKPGKPLVVGYRKPCVVLGLPGNPVSSFITALLFLRPALLASQGASHDALRLPEVPATAGETLANAGDRPHYLRGMLTDGVFQCEGLQQSHALGGLAKANAIARLDPGTRVPKGNPLRVTPLGLCMGT